MDDLNDPRISAYKPQRRLRLPAPPGYRPQLGKAQRKQKVLGEKRAEARATRLHLVLLDQCRGDRHGPGRRCNGCHAPAGTDQPPLALRSSRSRLAVAWTSPVIMLTGSSPGRTAGGRLDVRDGVVVEGHSRSILRSPCAGVDHSTTSIVASSLRWACTTSAMSAWKRSPSGPWVIGPAAIALAGHLRLARPLRLRALDRVDRGAVQGEPRIPAQIRALARVRHRTENQFAVLEDRVDLGDPRRPVGSQGGKCLVPVSIEQRPHAPRELRLCLLTVTPPRRHTAHDRTDVYPQACSPCLLTCDACRAERAPMPGKPFSARPERPKRDRNIRDAPSLPRPK